MIQGDGNRADWAGPDDELAAGPPGASTTEAWPSRSATLARRPRRASLRLLPLVLIGLCAALEAAAFLVDVLLPLEIATGMLYAGIVLAGLRFQQRGAILGLAAISTALAVLGLVATPDALTPEHWPVVVNRGLAVLAIWAVALVVIRERASFEALREGEERYQALIESSPDAVFVHCGGIITLANRQAAALFGAATPELLIGRSVFELIDETSLSLARTRTAALAAPGRRVGLAELTFRRLDGAPVAAEATSASVQLDGRLAVQVLLRDITGRKKAEAALRRSEARLRAIFDTAPEAIVVIDAQGSVESVNPAAEALFGYSAEEVVGRNVGLLMPLPDGEAHGGCLTCYLRTGERGVVGAGQVVKGRRKDGSLFPLELAVGEVAANDCPPCFVGFLRDLSAKERMERELRQAQKMEAVGQLTGGIAHDFNNLLTVVLGNLEMLEERLTGAPDLTLLREAQDAVCSGAELTGRLLAFARRQPLDPKPLDPRRQVEEAAALLRRTLGAAIEVRTVVPHDLPRALADPGQLQNALLNLALNARDAMPRGGVLVLEVVTVAHDAADAPAHAGLKPGRYVMLAVSDTGTGMPPEIRERAFEPFFTTKEAGAGTGLGLSMVYGFAKQSGGHAQIYSELGHGTTVRLYLPQAEMAGRAVPEPPALQPAAFAGHGEKVLVVEDDPGVHRYAVARLEGLGYRVLTAEDGPAALRLLEEGAPVDLLFTDVVMPGGMTGIELAQLASRQRPGLKVVLTSGYAEPELLRHGAMKLGRWLRKPYTALDLARTLRRALEAQGAGEGDGDGATAEAL